MGNFVLVCWNCRAVSAAESYRLWCLAQYHTYWVDLCALSFSGKRYVLLPLIVAPA